MQQLLLLFVSFLFISSSVAFKPHLDAGINPPFHTQQDESGLLEMYRRSNMMYSTARFPIHPYFSHRKVPHVNEHVAAANCVEKYFTQQLVDHFSSSPPPLNTIYFSQRYFVCDGYWNKQPNAPIFFYTGNEADVELYVNHTGLMFETAPEFGALLVFAEHRYFGKTRPFGNNTPKYMSYLSMEQALADFAHFLWWFKDENKLKNPPIIGFGGSYGGMLNSWFRMKYPGSIDGVISASSPILSFLNLDPPYDVNSYAKIETDDAGPKGGSNANCAANVRQAFSDIFSKGATDAGRKDLTSAFRLCTPLRTTGDAYNLANWLKSGWDFMAMGDYPYPTDYITNGNGVLPAFPMRVACNYLGMSSTASYIDRWEGMRQAVAIFYNVSGDSKCFDLNQSANNETALDGLYWDYLFCTEIFQPFGQDGVTDMFWNAPFNLQSDVAGCKARWNVDTKVNWIPETYGGYQGLRASSNMFFSNGALDPWHGGGVLKNMSSTVIAYMIDGAAHHLDLMFSNPLDPAPVIQARAAEKYWMKRWVNEKSV